MANITYQLRAEYVGAYTGGVVRVADDRSYDVGAALTAGSGTITVPDSDHLLTDALDAYGALQRTGSTAAPAVPPPPTTLRRMRLGRGASPGETVLQAGRDTDLYNRFEVDVDGNIRTGSGAAAPSPFSAASGQTFYLQSPIDSSHPGFRWRSHAGDFSPQPNLDPVGALGFNLAPTNQGDILARENTAYGNGAWCVEGDFQRSDASRTMEMYWSFRSVGATAIAWRPVSSYVVDYDTAGNPVTTREAFVDTLSLNGPPSGITFYEVHNTGDVLAFRFTTTATTIYGSALATTTQLLLGSNPGTGVSATQPCAIDLGYGGTSGIFRIDTQNATQAKITIAGNIAFRFFKLNSAFVAVGLNANRNDYALAIHGDPANNGAGLLAVRRNAGATAPMANFEDSTGTTLTKINKDGYIMTRKNATPVLADMVDGEMAFWVDASGNLKVTSRIAGALKNATVTVA